MKTKKEFFFIVNDTRFPQLFQSTQGRIWTSHLFFFRPEGLILCPLSAINTYFHQFIYNTLMIVDMKHRMYQQPLSVAAGIVLLVLVFCSANVLNIWTIIVYW